MRVVYLFVSKGGAGYKTSPKWSHRGPCDPAYLDPNGLPTEGIFYVLDKLQKESVIDELLIVFESSTGPGQGIIQGHKLIVVPELGELSPFITEKDIIFVRGGWRGWWEWLDGRKGKNWLINYSANTGRQRWKFWDIILWDINDICAIDRYKRMWITFRKPTHPGIFKNLSLPIEYDICIGASYIHDKKGQWRMIGILEEFRRLYGYVPKCIMPGSTRHATFTNMIINQAPNLNIVMPSMVPRSELAKIFNQSKVAVFLGSSGQNDRGPLEAMQCGCQLVIGSPEYHSPVVYENSKISWVPDNIEDFTSIAKGLKNLLDKWDAKNRIDIIKWNKKNSHADYAAFPAMSRMFNMIRENPYPDSVALAKEYLT